MFPLRSLSHLLSCPPPDEDLSPLLTLTLGAPDVGPRGAANRRPMQMMKVIGKMIKMIKRRGGEGEEKDQRTRRGGRDLHPTLPLPFSRTSLPACPALHRDHDLTAAYPLPQTVLGLSS